LARAAGELGSGEKCRGENPTGLAPSTHADPSGKRSADLGDYPTRDAAARCRVAYHEHTASLALG
jgi:hypothetical protein